MRPVDFPPAPILAELARGAAICRAGKGIDRVAEEDRRAIGYWFDGRVRKDVEDALWVSPAFCSRWLGYRAASEDWTQPELQARWDDLRVRLGGRLTMIVRLAALPKMDLLESGATARIDPTDLAQASFTLSYGPPNPCEANAALETRTVFTPEASLLALRRSRDRGEVLGLPWHRLVPFREPLLGEFESPEPPYAIDRGENARAIYLVQAPLPETLIWSRELRLSVRTPAKRREARFPIFTPGY